MDYQSQHKVIITFSKQEVIEALLSKAKHLYNKYSSISLEHRKGHKTQLILVEAEDEEENVINYSVTAD